MNVKTIMFTNSMTYKWSVKICTFIFCIHLIYKLNLRNFLSRWFPKFTQGLQFSFQILTILRRVH
jgi:hypothetical protein